jgi:hypothetical protein
MAPRQKAMDNKTKKTLQNSTFIQSSPKNKNLIAQGKIGKNEDIFLDEKFGVLS